MTANTQNKRQMEMPVSKDEHRRLKKRSFNIMKKASELSILCNADVAVIISKPQSMRWSVWPSTSTASNLIEQCFKADKQEGENNSRIKERLKTQDFHQSKPKVKDTLQHFCAPGCLSIVQGFSNKDRIAFLDSLLDEIDRRKLQLLQDYAKDLKLGSA